MGTGGVRSRRFLFAALVCVGVIWFMILAISVNRTILVPADVIISKHLKLVGTEMHALHSNSGLIFVSKRRVPNGPDPIHNSDSCTLTVSIPSKNNIKKENALHTTHGFDSAEYTASTSKDDAVLIGL